MDNLTKSKAIESLKSSLWLVILVVFGAGDLPLASWKLVYFVQGFSKYVGLYVWYSTNSVSIMYIYIYIYTASFSDIAFYRCILFHFHPLTSF